MTLLAIDGRFAGQNLAYLPPGYHCVAHLDNHPDIISCHPEYMKNQFISDIFHGLEVYTDATTALRMTNNMRHGNLAVLATQVLNVMVDVNLSIFIAQHKARKDERRKEN